MWGKLGVWMLLALACGARAWADEDSIVTLESLDGATEVEARTADGQIRQIHPGGEIQPGETITVPPTAAAHVAYEDGAQVLASSGTSFAVGRENGVPALDLKSGTVRTMVEPAAAQAVPVAMAPAAPKPFRFVIRSTSAALGVRGTDFVTETDGKGAATVHTLEGKVEVGKDAAELHRGAGQPIAANQFREVKPGYRLSQAQGFESRKFLSEFHQRHPRLEGLHRAAYQKVRSGELRQRFQKMREQRRTAVRPAVKPVSQQAVKPHPRHQQQKQRPRQNQHPRQRQRPQQRRNQSKRQPRQQNKGKRRKGK